MTIIVSFDGPKGVGKTTLIELLSKKINSLGKSVQVMTEKNLMAEFWGSRVDALYVELKNNPGVAADAALAAAHRQGRVHITNTQLLDPQSDVILLDRWYPSDAVFRRHLDISAVIKENISAGICIPDVEFSVTCDPKISWDRANLRLRQLDSKIITGFDEHVASTRRFEKAFNDYGWILLRTDASSAEKISDEALEIILLARQ